MTKGDGGEKTVRIGGGLAFFVDSMDGHSGLIRAEVDYIVYDHLAEISMSILASDPRFDGGYHVGFLDGIRPYLREMLDKGIKIVTNWGGLNPDGAAVALRALARELAKGRRIGVVRGDDLRPRLDDLKCAGDRDMFSGAALPDDRPISSANAYLGAFPIAAALSGGADVVITGRVADSALSLGALIHEFGWSPADYHQLAAGTRVGHLLECSTQATGGTARVRFNSIHHNRDYGRLSGAPDMYANTMSLQGMWERTVREFIGTAGTLRNMKCFSMRSFICPGDTMVVEDRVSRKWREGEVGLVEIAIHSRNGGKISVGPGTVTATLPLEGQP